MAMRSLGVVRMRWRRVLIVLVLVAAAVGFGLRIWWVNAIAFNIPVEEYSMGEWVSYDGCFLDMAEYEMNDGYSVRVDVAEVMSEREYVERYGVHEYWVSEPSDLHDKLVLTITIKNEGNTDEMPAINLISTYVIPPGKSRAIHTNLDLWVVSEPTLGKENVPFYFAISPDTEYTIHLPFDYLGFDGKPALITDDRFTLNLSSSPIKKQVAIELEN